ncbi:uncharacterized protein MKZ38_003340 [Zalerion maritima]|uniref:protein-ribulosamine 3-kinase n=1 Tax=Zalerion maritima TaxID=339359 RepID=A0AAD5RP07_9PEZI|nr:uncharacterized protein MKZ38_003340 [Zalerion maritima]
MTRKNSVPSALPEVGANFVLDDKVVECLPKGTRVLEAVTWGTSAWTNTAKVITELDDGTRKVYFLKCSTYPDEMMEGEFTSITAIYNLMPSFAPKPCGRGKFTTLTSSGALEQVYFFIMEFLDIKITMPEPARFCRLVSEMHHKSVSPTGMFGFEVPTCHGKNMQPNSWTPSWRACFTELITKFFDEEIKVNGPWPEYEKAFESLTTKVIPHLLDPLQAKGRTLKPCLIHGDLWEENTGVDIETGHPVVFDASCFYAHNEYELGMWRREIIRFGQPYFRHYMLRFPPSEPTEQWDDRNRLYSLVFNISHSSHFPGAANSRNIVYNDLCYLINTYCTDTTDGTASAAVSEMVGTPIKAASTAVAQVV